MSENEINDSGADAASEGRSEPRQNSPRGRHQQPRQDFASEQAETYTELPADPGDGNPAAQAGPQQGGGPQQGQNQGGPRRGRRDRRGRHGGNHPQGNRGGNFNFDDEEYDESKNGGGNGPLIDLNEL
ncbi:MAG: hypothetical protein LBQ20_10600, partial [Rhodanobacter sp.]|nr:hypothetical protein [Rhodanobacter sp.]